MKAHVVRTERGELSHMFYLMKSPVFLCRQGPTKPEVLSIQWPGKRSARRLQRNNSLSLNSPHFSTGMVFHILKIFKTHAYAHTYRKIYMYIPQKFNLDMVTNLDTLLTETNLQFTIECISSNCKENKHVPIDLS